jgi:hypothetical protein
MMGIKRRRLYIKKGFRVVVVLWFENGEKMMMAGNTCRVFRPAGVDVRGRTLWQDLGIEFHGLADYAQWDAQRRFDDLERASVMA